MHVTIEPDSSAPISTRAESARINGAQSNGPVTPEGRARSSRNSLRHGLTAKAVVLETESPEEFAALLNAFLDRFHPADPVEQELVEAMAAARWRLRRLYSIESRMFNLEMLLRVESFDQEFTEADDTDRLADAFKSLANSGPTLALLIRYETTLNRTFDRALKQLTQLQSSPRPTPAPGTSDGHLGSFRIPRNPPAPAREKGERSLCPQPQSADPIDSVRSGQSGLSTISSPVAEPAAPPRKKETHVSVPGPLLGRVNEL